MDTIKVEEVIGRVQKPEQALAHKLKSCKERLNISRKEDGKWILSIFPIKGNNLIIECENLEEVKAVASKVELNIEKARLEGKEVSISTSNPDKERKKVKIDGLAVPIDPEDIQKIQECEDKITELEDDLEIDEIKQLIEIDKLEKIIGEKKIPTAIYTDIDEITICNEKMKSNREVAEFLIEKSNISASEDKKIIDLNKNHYEPYTQDILLQHIFVNNIYLTDEQRNVIQRYKMSSKINNVYRGKGEVSQEQLEEAITFAKIIKSFPKIKEDIVVYRGGSSANKSKEIGSENKWESPISFTTNEELAKKSFGRGGVIYKTVLKAGSVAIPPDILKGIHWIQDTENELILPPLSYQVMDAKNKQQSDKVELDIDILEFEDPMISLENSMKKIQEQLNVKIKEAEKSEIRLKEMDSEQEIKRLEFLGYNEKDIQEEQLDIKDIIKELEGKGEFKEFLERDSKIEKNPLQYQSYLHGTDHTRRVAFFATILSDLGGLDQKDKSVLMKAVQYHDIGRINDYEDKQHGASSVEKIEGNSKALKDFNTEDQELIKFIIEQHSKPKKENEEAILELDDTKKERYQTLLNYMKDSDKLDRVRLGKYDGLDVSRLSLPSSKKMIKVAYQTHEHLFDIINMKNKDIYEKKVAKIQEYIEIINEEKDKPIENVKVESLTYFDDEEKQIQNEEMIESKVEEKQEQDIENGLQKDVQQEYKWMDRFKGWYSAIDKVSEKSKAFFVKMKSDIIKSISNKIRERANDKQNDNQNDNKNDNQDYQEEL